MTYQGYEVLDFPVAVDSINLTLKSKFNIIGDLWQARSLNVQHNPYNIIKFTFWQDDNAQRKEIRDFFIARKGKHERFFVRSYKKDLRLLYDVANGDNLLTCAQGHDLQAFLAHSQYLFIEGHGTLYEILEVSEGYDYDLDDQVVVIKITPGAPFLLEKDCTLLEYAYFGRWDTDTLSFDFHDIWGSGASLTFREASDVEIGELLA